VAPTLSSRAVGLPGTNAFSQVTLAIGALQKTEGPGELTFRLAADSQPYYHLERSPLKLPVPTKGSTNSTIARVRATGVAPIRERNGELSPP